jgi:hypothetical protein
MAKKKSKKIDLNLVVKTFVLLFGIAIVCFGFLGSVTFTGNVLGSQITYSAFNVMFGVENALAFSFMTLVAYLLPIAGIVLLIFNNKLLNIVSTICFVVGAVLLFLIPSFVVLAESSILTLYTASLAVGAILSAVFSIICAAGSAYVAFYAKK